ncbi:hypothetical protein TrLO_g1149 [Triparma laevis f. longispina]|uniref:Uncharacterized protein n=1 Tax=Triparma laevis f. longispina TaxID=1714387 RepID=A0A9W7CB03_9STRA|nr:hypothetical protein TrLO_g1149 [Triparma laevis f. longispina]
MLRTAALRFSSRRFTTDAARDAPRRHFPPPPPPPKYTVRHAVYPVLLAAAGSFVVYLKFYSKGDAQDYWRGVDRGDIDKPMFEIGMKGRNGGGADSDEE